MKRRDFMKISGAGFSSLAFAPAFGLSSVKMTDQNKTLEINPTPKFKLSPWLYMQFMEPLGATDSSVEAAWDHGSERWRDDVIKATRELAPGMIRWGGCFSSYYKWKEAVGPRDRRKPMYNILWGGMESNQIGTAEFTDFCKQVDADPLMSVNFESDGQASWALNRRGENRRGDAAEAAEWVDYCNNPSNKLRRSNGEKEPHPIKLWQIGNETSYSRERFDLETAAKKTATFSQAMKGVDSSIQTIGWGDSGWAPKMLEMAGDHMDYIAFHHMFDPGRDIKDSPLRDNIYRKDPTATWEILMDAYKMHERKIKSVYDEVKPYGKPLAMTECHYALPGRNRCEVLSSWAAGVSYARLMNLHERYGDLLKIATLADFCGTRWQVNAIMIPVPEGRSFLMPVAKIMSLYRNHTGTQYLEVANVPEGLDITASRSDDTIYLHVVNTKRSLPVRMHINATALNVKSAKAFELSGDPDHEIMSAENDAFIPRERVLDMANNKPIIFSPASVTAVELRLNQTT